MMILKRMFALAVCRVTIHCMLKIRCVNVLATCYTLVVNFDSPDGKAAFSDRLERAR